MKLKRYLQEHHKDAVTRERNFLSKKDIGRTAGWNGSKILMLAIIAAAIAGVHASGVLERFDADTLQQAVASWGWLAPVMFMAVYTLAPSLFLPGLPFTIAGGVLFGPFWGVVYSIAGATAGASLAFLISRYLARDWVAAKLTGPRWRKLEAGVEKNGWKIVAFTRLIPLFPFNLLNYAFGLTSIRFLPYVLTSFICMLPACIAFIVFSSSLVDVIKGEIPPGLVAGIVLILLVSLIPAMWRRIKARNGGGLNI